MGHCESVLPPGVGGGPFCDQSVVGWVAMGRIARGDISPLCLFSCEWLLMGVKTNFVVSRELGVCRGVELGFGVTAWFCGVIARALNEGDVWKGDCA